MYDIFGAAKGAGAHAAWLSGAGSSIAAICPPDGGRPVASAMQGALEAAGYSGRHLVTHIAGEGACVSKVELVEA
jgi:homoserine kinase